MTDIQIIQLLGLAYFSAGLGAIINPGLFKKAINDYMENLARNLSRRFSCADSGIYSCQQGTGIMQSDFPACQRHRLACPC